MNILLAENMDELLTLGLPYMAEKAYGGRLPEEPMENA